jgi:hypothetical protein
MSRRKCREGFLGEEYKSILSGKIFAEKSADYPSWDSLLIFMN